mgnify:CR=1 FL=1
MASNNYNHFTIRYIEAILINLDIRLIDGSVQFFPDTTTVENFRNLKGDLDEIWEDSETAIKILKEKKDALIQNALFGLVNDFELSLRTGCSKDAIFDLTLESYKGILFPYFHDSGILKWLLPLNIFHRKRAGFGQQYCSECLKEDEEPYFRKHWRVAFNTFCSKHQVMHRDRCPECKHPIMFHRNELGKPHMFDGPEMCFCTTCEFDLRKSERQSVDFIEVDSQAMFFRSLEF